MSVRSFSMASKPILFDGDSDDSGDGSLTINKNYAQRYEEWREAEVKRRLEDKYGSGEEASLSDSSSEEDNHEELEQAVSKDFFEVISSLKTKDPRIYNPKVKFFESKKGSDDFDAISKNESSKKGERSKPIYLRDYERKLITEKGGKLSDDESDEENKKREARAASPSYMEEQQQIKNSFKKVLLSDDSEDDDGNLLQKKSKTKVEKEKEEEDYLAWLKGEKEDIPDHETEQKLKPLKQLWNDPNLDESEKFLRDYVLNKRYMDKDESVDPGNLTDDEFMDEYMNEFERNYNFRFEEPDKEFLKRYPRNIEQSLRRKDTKRMERRKAVEERKKEEKKRKTEELKLLKSLKRKEILKKIEKIKQITGNEDLGLQPEELEDDFDPEAHDRRMQELFNDNYYKDAEDVEDVEDLNIPPLEDELLNEDDNENWDEWDGTERDRADHHEEPGNQNLHCDDPDFNMDCDYDPSAEYLRKEEKSAGRRSAKEKRKLKRQSRFGRLVRKKKPVFDPNDKSFQEYVNEYYGMDYEDLIGDIPCRFKYTSVVPCSFGLTIEEILAADDKELNRWASIKKAYTIRSEHVERNEAKIYEMKARDEALKRKILPSLYKHENANYDSAQKDVKKSEKKNKKMFHLEDNYSENKEVVVDKAEDTTSVEEVSTKKKKKKKPQMSQNFEISGLGSADMNTLDAVVAEESSRSSSKKKKKKSHNNETGAFNASAIESSPTDQVAVTKSNRKKKKTKKLNKERSAFDTSAMESTPTDQAKGTETSIKPRENNETSSLDYVLEGTASNEGPPKRKKKKNRRSTDSSNFVEAQQSDQCNSVSNSMKRQASKEETEGIRKKRLKVDPGFSVNGMTKNEKHKNFHKNQRNSEKIEFSDARLKAYGIHPKKFKKKLKYGKK